jgi:hypothetical protein
MLWVALPTVYHRLEIQTSGTIINAETRYEPRRATYYSIKTPSGLTETIISGATDASLPRDISIGTFVEKAKWHIGYSLDHVYTLGFPVYFYGGLILIASFLLLQAAIGYFRYKNTAEQGAAANP